MLLLYGINAFWLALVHNPQKNPRKQLTAPKAREFSLAGLSYKHYSPILLTEEDLPVVTVQLPIFNERYVAQRLLDAICQLDYPRDRLYIQVLDDSTDDTQVILQTVVNRYQQEGIWVDYIHRTDRSGFKAGALQSAMPRVQGNYIAIFDADFVPSADWLKLTMPHFQTSDRIAVVQTRWGHMNSEYSLLTKLQGAGLDGHFVIDQQARWCNGYFLNFNGTAGIWHKAAIADAGGWHADTLAEDMDLSYRAQLKGWKVIYDNDIVAVAELPVTMVAYKLQQFRWAKGGIQCAKKLLPTIWQSRQRLAVKWQATMHLTGYGAHPLMLMTVLLSLPLMLLVPSQTVNIQALKNISINMWQVCMILATFVAPSIYLIAQKELHPHTWYRRLDRVILLLLLCSGMSLSNSRAVFAGLFNKGANFRRTPKFNITAKSDRWLSKAYRLPFDFGAVLELGLCIYSAYAIYISAHVGWYSMIPFLTIYSLGYGYVGGLTLWQYCQQFKQFKS